MIIMIMTRIIRLIIIVIIIITIKTIKFTNVICYHKPQFGHLLRTMYKSCL